METKDIVLVIVAILGWIWGIVQWFINRKNQKKDKLVDRRYDAYSTYMKKMDEIMNGVRNDPNMIYGILTDFIKAVVTKDVEKINDELIKINENLIDFVKKGSEPLMIIKQELNALLIICSGNLKIKIDELIVLVTDYNNEMQKCLSKISSNDSNTMAREFQTLSHNDRWLRFQTLNAEIVEQMRIEIGNK